MGVRGVANTSSCALRAVAVHLPSGPSAAAKRKRYVQALIGGCDGKDEGLLLVGDVNAKDDEVGGLCVKAGLHEARYHGYSWGARGNRFDKEGP